MRKFVRTISSVHGGTIFFSDEKDGWCASISQERVELLMKHFRVDKEADLSGKTFESTTKKEVKSLLGLYSRIPRIWRSHIGQSCLWMFKDVSYNKEEPKLYELNLVCVQPGGTWERVSVKEPGIKLLMQYFRVRKPEDLVGKTFEKAGISPTYTLLLDLTDLNLI